MNCTTSARCAKTMTEDQWFAFTILPIMVGIAGTIISEITVRRNRC